MQVFLMKCVSETANKYSLGIILIQRDNDNDDQKKNLQF